MEELQFFARGRRDHEAVCVDVVPGQRAGIVAGLSGVFAGQRRDVLAKLSNPNFSNFFADDGVVRRIAAPQFAGRITGELAS